MTSKAAKLRSIRMRQKAGRPRKEGDRYPGGQLKHSERREDTIKVAMEARMKMHNVASVIFKGRDLSGFTLGRMHLDKKITEPELEAGLWFAEADARYRHSVGLPPANTQAQDLLRVRGFDGDVSESAQTRATRATSVMMKLEGILLREGPGVKQTVRSVCVEDIEGMRLMPAGQLRMLKRGLRALAIARGVE